MVKLSGAISFRAELSAPWAIASRDSRQALIAVPNSKHLVLFHVVAAGPQSIEYSARHGFNYVGLGSAAMIRGAAEAYRRVWNTHRQDPGRLNAHVLEPKVGVSRQVGVANTDAEALAAARPPGRDE